MITFKDKTYCSSPGCTNKCGRKMTELEKNILKANAANDIHLPVCYAYFCDIPDEYIAQTKTNSE